MQDRKDQENNDALTNHALTLLGLLAPLLSELKFGRPDFEVTYNRVFKKNEALVNTEFFEFDSFASPLKNGANPLVTAEEEDGLPACALTFPEGKKVKEQYDMYHTTLLEQKYEFQKSQSSKSDRRWAGLFDTTKKCLRIPSEKEHMQLIKGVETTLSGTSMIAYLTVKENGEGFFPENVSKIIFHYYQDIFFQRVFFEYLMQLIRDKNAEIDPSHERVEVSLSLFEFKKINAFINKPNDDKASTVNSLNKTLI